jgi:hypothetical protein
MEMGRLLHEKIQLYIYKPSINLESYGIEHKNKLPVLWGVY